MIAFPGLPLPLDFKPMEAKLVAVLPDDRGWQFEPKWDGFRCLAFRSGHEVELRAKSGKPLSRYFPDVVAALKALPLDRFVLDGELTIPINGELSFEALQMRLHPAQTRVRRLAAETPATFVLFDCLVDCKGRCLADAPLTERRAALDNIFKRFNAPDRLRLSPATDDVAEASTWLSQSGAALDGVIAKRLNGPYAPGERAMLKVKRLRTADCVVGGFRYETDSSQVGSLLLGLFNDAGKLDHVGYTSSISEADRPALTKRLEALAGGAGFTGDAPGAHSRWSNGRTTAWTPLQTKLVAEVRYDHVTGDRFRHGTSLVRWRPDKAPEQCTIAQLRSDTASLLGENLSG